MIKSLQLAPAFSPAGADLSQPAYARSELTARLAFDTRTRNDAFGLRHKSYLAGHHIDRRPDNLFSDQNDEMPNTRTLVIYAGREAIASVRMCILDTKTGLRGWDDIPARHVFPREVESLLAVAATGNGGRKPVKAIEINRLVRHPDCIGDYALVAVLFRFVAFMVTHEQSDMTLSCVRGNHMAFYKRLMFAHVAGPRAYPELKFETNLMVCMQSSYQSLRQSITMFDPDAVPASSYAGLFRGETVAVWGSRQ